MRWRPAETSSFSVCDAADHACGPSRRPVFARHERARGDAELRERAPRQHACHAEFRTPLGHRCLHVRSLFGEQLVIDQLWRAFCGARFGSK